MHASLIRAAGLLVLSFWPISLLNAYTQEAASPAAISPQHSQPGERDAQGSPVSELTLENLNYVAASASQIEEVLRSQPGLLVELEHWIARDASAHGQIVDEYKMSQEGIFDRLEHDLQFRAVATRLLQRYGYLQPEVNPDVRSIAVAAAPGGAELPTVGENRQASSPPSPPPPPAPNRWLNAAAPPSLLQETEHRPATARQPALPAPGTAAAANLPDIPALPPGGSASRAQMEQELRERGVESPSPPGGTLVRPGAYPRSEPQSRNRYEQKPSHPEILRRANPYAHVPSLYDLYEQVSPQSPDLQRFGMNIFENAPADTTGLPIDLPAGPDYVVGPGDGLVVNLWGGVAERLYRVVDREGRLSLPEVGPVMVSGATMAVVQQRIQEVLRTQFRDTSADISLARLRTVRVYVVGEVKYPGAYDLSSLSTPLNALFAVGGPSPDASLRRVRHFRGKSLVQNVDLYDLLLRGVRSDLQRLETGDTLLVPPMVSEVRVEGMVRRPAIYELHGEKTLAQVLELAGGILPTAALRHIEVQRVVHHQKRTMLSLNIDERSGPESIERQLHAFEIYNSDIVRIFPIAPYNQDTVYLEGHVLRPGRYSYRPNLRLADLVGSYSDLLPEPALRYAEIIRLNPPDYHPSVESFDLENALARPESSPKLQPLDTVRIFSRFDFQNAPTVSIDGEVRYPGTYRTSGVVHVRDAVYQAGGVTSDAMLDSTQLVRSLPEGKLEIFSLNLGKALAGDPLENVLLRPRDRLLVHRNQFKADPPSVYVQGEVVRAGRFPLTTNLRISDLVRMAGGLKRSADSGAADLTRYELRGTNPKIGEHREIDLAGALEGKSEQDILLHDGDVLTVKGLAGWSDVGAAITLRGEVRHPGTYGIAPGERLSSVLERAGGFLPTAYPKAAVLQRVEVKKLQEFSRNELVQQVQREASNIKVSLNENASDRAALQNAAAEQHRRVLEALRSTPVSGRLVIRLSSDLPAFAGSSNDIQTRAGDVLLVPKRPDFVLVTGQVYNSNALAFERGKTARWYLSRAGGVTSLGNKKAIFIIRSDGSVVSGLENRWWHGDVLGERLAPGDMVVVPDKPIGGSTLWKNLIQISQVAASAAIAAAVATQ